ncbi:MAG: extracellular solute-binding protein [Alphaproteobacteria bacterium]
MSALVFLLLATPAQADHAIAMHGAPKYGADFKHYDYVNPDAPTGGTLRLGIAGSFDSVNPFALRGRAAFGASAASGQLYLYDSLLARSQDEPFTLYGLIAEDVKAAPDFSSVTFKINPAARFHDGRAITSADVLFSWQTFRDHGRPNQRTYYSKVTRVETPDKQTAIFHFTPGARGGFDREMPLIMGMMQVLPESAWRARDLTAPSLTPQLGSGPYKIKSIDPGHSIIWERVDNYWAKDLPSQRGLYNFDEIRVDYYRNDQAALQAFKSGQYDVRREIDPAKWETAYTGPNLDQGFYQLTKIPHGRTDLRAYAINLRRPLFQDRALRQAINMAFDFDWINRVLFYGQYQRCTSFFTNSELAATGLPGKEELKLLQPHRAILPPELFTQKFAPAEQKPKDFSQNLRAAQRLLQAAEYRLRDGKLYNPRGEAVAFTIILGDANEEKVALNLARNLRALGMDVDVRVLDSAQFQMRQTSFDYDLMLVRWVNSLSPGNEQAIYWGSAATDQPGTRNYAGIKNPAVDDLVTKITTAPSRAALVTATRALDRVLQWGFYVVPLYYLPADHVAVAAGLARPEKTPLYGYVQESWWQDYSQLTKGK